MLSLDAVERAGEALIARSLALQAENAALSRFILHTTEHLQERLDHGGRIDMVEPGFYNLGLATPLVLRQEVQLNMAPGVVLMCAGLRSDVKYSTYIEINGGAIYGQSSNAGIDLRHCRARLRDIDVRWGFKIGLHVQHAIHSRYDGCLFRGSQNAMLLTPLRDTDPDASEISTTQSFASCYFWGGEDAAVRLGRCSSVVMTQPTFEHARRGLVVNFANTVTVDTPHFEVIREELLLAGDEDYVRSLSVRNAEMYDGKPPVGNAAIPAIRVDRVGVLNIEGGYSSLQRETFIQTTTRTGQVDYLRPASYFPPGRENWGDPAKVRV